MKNFYGLETRLGLVVVLALALGAMSCSKKDVRPDEPGFSPSEGGEGLEGDAGASDGFALDGNEEPVTSAGEAGETPVDMRIVYFAFDSYSLGTEGRDALKANAEWLANNPSATVQIEGHCDERGTIEYNLALGERRANAAKDYLVRLGVGADRISIISYGKERPAEFGSNESAWSRNRRAEFVIVSR